MTTMALFRNNRARRSVDQSMAEAGWGVKSEWRVPRRSGAPLYFSVRLPDGSRFLDVSELTAQAADRLPVSVRPAAEAVAAVEGGPGIICTSALIADEEPGKVVAVLTAGFAEGVTGLPDVEALGIPSRGEELRRAVIPISDQAVMLDRTSLERLDPADEPVPMLLNQYLMESRYGALSMAFTTTLTGMFSEEGRGLMGSIARTGWLGETPDSPR
jgi:hypothetical protein